MHHYHVRLSKFFHRLPKHHTCEYHRHCHRKSRRRHCHTLLHVKEADGQHKTQKLLRQSRRILTRGFRDHIISHIGFVSHDPWSSFTGYSPCSDLSNQKYQSEKILREFKASLPTQKRSQPPHEGEKSQRLWSWVIGAPFATKPSLLTKHLVDTRPATASPHLRTPPSLPSLQPTTIAYPPWLPPPSVVEGCTSVMVSIVGRYFSAYFLSALPFLVWLLVAHACSCKEGDHHCQLYRTSTTWSWLLEMAQIMKRERIMALAYNGAVSSPPWIFCTAAIPVHRHLTMDPLCCLSHRRRWWVSPLLSMVCHCKLGFTPLTSMSPAMWEGDIECVSDEDMALDMLGWAGGCIMLACLLQVDSWAMGLGLRPRCLGP